MEAKDDVIEGLCMLCDDADTSDDLQLTLAQFVCIAYRPKCIDLSSIPELHWHLFCKYMAESEKQTTTLGTLKQHILTAHVQGRTWSHAAVPRHELLDPLENSYHRDSDNGQLQPTTTDVPQAPEPSWRWSGFSAREIVHRIALYASPRTCHARTYIFATHSAKMTLTRITTIVNQMIIVMVGSLL